MSADTRRQLSPDGGRIRASTDETEDAYRRRADALAEKQVDQDEAAWLSELSASILGE